MLVLIMCFGFRKRFPLLFYVANCFDKKAKTNADRTELTTKTC